MMKFLRRSHTNSSAPTDFDWATQTVFDQGFLTLYEPTKVVKNEISHPFREEKGEKEEEKWPRKQGEKKLHGRVCVHLYVQCASTR